MQAKVLQTQTFFKMQTNQNALDQNDHQNGDLDRGQRHPGRVTVLK